MPTADDDIAAHYDETRWDVEYDVCADALHREANRICMGLNTPVPHAGRDPGGRGQPDRAARGRVFPAAPAVLHRLREERAQGGDVFINSDCHFQDRGGIEIGDGAMIGHNVVLAAINHDLSPKRNRKMHYAPIKIGVNV